MIRNINHDWNYAPVPYDKTENTAKMERVHLPHTNCELPLTYFDERVYQFVSHYVKTVTATKEEAAGRSFIIFEGVMAKADVYLNGQKLGEHWGGYTRFSFEMTGILQAGDNTLVVEVDSRELDDMPPFGFAIDYLTFGGIYRDVDLRFTGNTCIKNVFARPEQVLSEKKALRTDLTLDAAEAESGVITLTLRGDGVEASAEQEVALTAGENTVSITMSDLAGIRLWSLEDPALYELTVSYRSENCADETVTRVGFRTAEFTDHGFFLNGERVKIRGLNRHQSFPVVGYAMPRRAQRKDAEILKCELGLNLVRTSHYPNSKYFLDRCDELGLMVFTELPGWQHVGNDTWKRHAVDSLREMILTDRNHPSIILWGVRINESKDDHDFYLETNALAHELDPTRQTSGVRCITNSELLEDVYAMNDFCREEVIAARDQQVVTGLDHKVPYLISEMGGHMYPTKRYDGEDRSIRHTENHMMMHNTAGLDDSISGVIGWCAFDYHTHNNFGSGDKICYHGVYDMFRIPKMAASFYKSQRDPKKYGPVIEAATNWTVGDRSQGGINPLYIFTNCDRIEVYTNDKLFGTYYPDHETFAGLPHPPCLVTDFHVVWGQRWGSAVMRGYIGDEKVIERRYAHKPMPTILSVEPDDASISADGIDVTRVVVKACDQAGNPMPYFFSPLSISVSGAGRLIGDSEVSLIGGVYAFWVKAGEEPGEIKIHLSSPRFEDVDLTIAAK